LGPLSALVDDSAGKAKQVILKIHQQVQCNRVRDRYEEEDCAHTCALGRAQADAVPSYANGMKGVICDYKRKQIKRKYAKIAYMLAVIS
jgi:hypothetical protein